MELLQGYYKAASRVGYVDSFGDSEVPPYFEYFYAGGPYSIKGYETNSLGPRITPVPCYSYVSAEDYCPPLIDNNFDGEPDAPYYNSYAQYGINRPIGGNVLKTIVIYWNFKFENHVRFCFKHSSSCSLLDHLS